MNTDTFSKTLLELYRLARSVPMADFQRRALDAISARFDFDSAWWGIASLEPDGTPDIHTSLPYRLPAFYPSLWADIKQDDNIAKAVMVTPATTVNFDHARLNESPRLGALMARFGITQCLCTVTLLQEVNLMTFLSVYRVQGKPAFSENERRYMQLLMPHLTAALTSNWMLHLERIRANQALPGTSLAVVDRRGTLHVADQALSALLLCEWPHWVGPTLPDPLLPHLREGTAFQGKRLAVRFHALADLWLLDLRPVGETVRLTPRETEIARQFSDGASYKEIAKALGMAPSTARHHLREVYRKLAVSNKAELARKLGQAPGAEIDVEGLPMLEELPGAPMRFAQLPI